MSGPLRVLGVAVPDVSDWREPLPAGKWSQFFGALSKRVTLLDTIRPQPARAGELWQLARSLRGTKAAWLARAGFDVAHAERLGELLEPELARREGSYDLIVQLQTLCTPGAPAARRPYVVYTDNTFALTQRIYPRSAPLAPARVRAWLGLEAEICARAQRVFTFSEYARRSVIEDYGRPPSSVVAIGAGANQLLADLAGKGYERPLALFVGEDAGRKGLPVLLRAWPAVRRAVPGAELIVAGPHGRPPRDGLGPGVSWLGRVERARLEQLYRDARVFVLPSLFEPWGHVFVEAMGHGLPCIGTSCCAMPELIEDGVTGRLVPRGEPEPLAAALIELLRDPARAAEMGRLAHGRVLERLTWSGVVDRLLEHLPPGGAGSG